MSDEEVKCPACNGDGVVGCNWWTELCSYCKGTGLVTKKEAEDF